MYPYAYNEENNIKETIEAAVKVDYNNKEIIVVDNNSTDSTPQIVKELIKKYRDVKLVHEQKKGKSHALNTAVNYARNDIIITVDADTYLDKDSVKKIVKWFKNEKTGAVAGNVLVGNRKNMPTFLAAVEWWQGINFVRRGQAATGNVMILPGAFTVFRKDVIKQVSGWDSDTVSEDFDITLKINKIGYKTYYEEEALAYSESPNSFKELFRQRTRWMQGGFQVIFQKHFEFPKKLNLYNFEYWMFIIYGWLGILLMPLQIAVGFLFFKSIILTMIIYSIIFSYIGGFYMSLLSFAIDKDEIILWSPAVPLYSLMFVNFSVLYGAYLALMGNNEWKYVQKYGMIECIENRKHFNKEI